MEAVGNKKVYELGKYKKLFPKAPGKRYEVSRNATVWDTVRLIKKVVANTLPHTAKIAKELEGRSLEETCRNLWNWTWSHVAYLKDTPGIEEVRSPRRLMADQHGDCDCMTTYLASCLTNLSIPHSLRLAEYSQGYLQHIYIIVHKPGGGYFTMDCVVNQFDYEEPYTRIKDVPMKLHYLDGIEGADERDGMEQEGVDANLLGELGLFNKLRRKIKERWNKIRSDLKKMKFRDFANIFNKLNPVAALLRKGILASMSLNILGVAGGIRYGLMDSGSAKRKGLDPAKHEGVKRIYDKLSDIFYAAGGKRDNLAHAIVNGKGNRDRFVTLSGLGTQDYLDERVLDSYSIHTPMPELLGSIYYEESSPKELGIVLTTTAIGAATTVLKVVSDLLKKNGDPTEGGNSGDSGSSANRTAPPSAAPENGGGKEDSGSLAPTTTPDNSASKLDFRTQQRQPLPDRRFERRGWNVPARQPQNAPAASVSAEATHVTRPFAQMAVQPGASSSASGGFVQWVKDNKLIASVAAVTAVTALVLSIKALSGPKGRAVSGVPRQGGKKKLVCNKIQD